MARVSVIVEMDMAPHSFVGSATEARALVENMLHRHPQYSTQSMTVTTGNVVAYDKPVIEETAGDNVHNIFLQQQQQDGNRWPR